MVPNSDDLLDISIKPPIYSKRAIFWFSFFMTPLFGGVLLMQNFKDIGKRKEAITVFIISIVMTLLSLFILFYLEIESQIPSIGLNLANALILTDFFFKKYLTDAQEYPRKNIWIPLLIAVAILISFFFLVIWVENQVV